MKNYWKWPDYSHLINSIYIISQYHHTIKQVEYFWTSPILWKSDWIYGCQKKNQIIKIWTWEKNWNSNDSYINSTKIKSQTSTSLNRQDVTFSRVYPLVYLLFGTIGACIYSTLGSEHHNLIFLDNYHGPTHCWNICAKIKKDKNKNLSYVLQKMRAGGGIFARVNVIESIRSVHMLLDYVHMTTYN